MRRRFLGLFSFWFLILSPAILLVAEKGAKAEETIRVLILREVPRVKITGQDLILEDLETGRLLFQNKRISSLTAYRGANLIVRTEDHSVSAQALTVHAPKAPLNLNGRDYRGKLHLYPGAGPEVLSVVNELPLEEYLVGLINVEISSQWRMEALKAQVVAARTYALFQKIKRAGDLYHLESSTNDQMYGGIQPEDSRSRMAVHQTEREIIVFQGKPIFAVYSACCGGKTESADLLWTGYLPYLQSRECNFCRDSPHFFWNWTVTAESLGRSLASAGFPEAQVREIKIQERSASQRVLRLVVRGDRSQTPFSGKDFRRFLGFDRVRSTQFTVKKENGLFFFSGLGWGHGAGVCQWGAKGMAEAGADYRTILKYYYRGIELGKIPQ